MNKKFLYVIFLGIKSEQSVLLAHQSAILVTACNVWIGVISQVHCDIL